MNFKNSPVTVGHLRQRLKGIPDDVTVADRDLATWLAYTPEQKRLGRIGRWIGRIIAWAGGFSMFYIILHFIDKYW